MKKKLLTVLLSLLAPILLMSHNVGAVSLTLNADYVDSLTNVNFDFLTSSSSSWVSGPLFNSGSYPAASVPNLMRFRSTNTYPIVEGDFYEVKISIFNASTSIGEPVLWRPSSSAFFDVISWSLDTASIDYSYLIDGYVCLNSRNCDAIASSSYQYTYTFILKSTGSGNRQIIFGDGSTTFFSSNLASYYAVVHPVVNHYKTSSSSGSLGQIENNTNQTNDLLEQQQQQDQEDRDDLQNTSDESKDQADEASGEATEQATSLLQAFISFVNWVTDIKATNCNLNIGELYGFNIGNLNLCTYSPPQWVSGALAIVIGLAIAGMSYKIVTRIIKIYQTIIGGDKS